MPMKISFSLVQGDGHGVLVAQLRPLAGDGHVQLLGLQPLVEGGLLDGLVPLGEGLGEGLADLVGQLAHDGPLLGGQGAHHLQDGGELALLAQVLDPQAVQLLGVLGPGQGGQGLGADLFQFFPS